MITELSDITVNNQYLLNLISPWIESEFTFHVTIINDTDLKTAISKVDEKKFNVRSYFFDSKELPLTKTVYYLYDEAEVFVCKKILSYYPLDLEGELIIIPKKMIKLNKSKKLVIGSKRSIHINNILHEDENQITGNYNRDLMTSVKNGLLKNAYIGGQDLVITSEFEELLMEENQMINEQLKIKDRLDYMHELDINREQERLGLLRKIKSISDELTSTIKKLKIFQEEKTKLEVDMGYIRSNIKEFYLDLKANNKTVNINDFDILNSSDTDFNKFFDRLKNDI